MGPPFQMTPVMRAVSVPHHFVGRPVALEPFDTDPLFLSSLESRLRRDGIAVEALSIIQRLLEEGRPSATTVLPYFQDLERLRLGKTTEYDAAVLHAGRVVDAGFQAVHAAWLEEAAADVLGPASSAKSSRERVTSSPVLPRGKIVKGRLPWNPYFLGPNAAIHRDLGDVIVVKKESDAYVLRIPGLSGTLTTLKQNVVFRKENPKGFREIEKERLEKYHYIPLAFALYLFRSVRGGNKLGASLVSLPPNHPLSEINHHKSLFPSIYLAMAHYRSGNSYFWDNLDLLKGWIGETSFAMGIDLVAFALKLCAGSNPADVLREYSFLTDRPSASPQSFATASGRRRASRRGMAIAISLDLIRGYLPQRPWQERWQGPVSGNVAAAGRYYTGYYEGEKPGDLTPLYFRLREGEQEALGESVDRMRPLLTSMLEKSKDPLLVPIPSDAAPTEKMATRLGGPHRLATLNPWQPRPADYGEGVEGKTTLEKLHLLFGALRLHPGFQGDVADRDIVLIDDNVTDAATFLVARKQLMENGARSVRLLTLTQTIRDPSELGLALF